MSRTAHGSRATLRWGVVLVVLGVILGVVGVAGVVIQAGSGLRADLTAPVRTTPAAFSEELKPGTYLVYELTGTTRRLGPVTTTRGTFVTLAPEQVQVTARDGTPLPVGPPTATETLTRGDSTFTGAARFVVATSGTYRVAVSAPDLKVVVAPSIVSSFGRSIRWIGLVLLGGLLCVVGVVLIIVRLVRRRRVPVTGTPVAGWFPDPSGQARLRWFDGYRWTDHTG